MKQYFEYKFSTEIKNRLMNYYENTKLNQHNINHFLKSDLKLHRINKLINFEKNDLVLDIGCSSGHFLNRISGFINKGLGIDISRSIIESNSKHNQINNISFQIFDGQNIDLKDKYNKILLIDVLEHAFYPDQLMKSIKKNIASDGLLIVEVPFTGFLSELIFGDYHEGHLRYYDPQHLTNYLESFGYKVQSLCTYNSVPLASKIMKIPFLFKFFNFATNLIPSSFYPYFGEIIIVAKNEE